MLVLSLKGLGAEPRVCTVRMCNEMICENLMEILKNKKVNFLRHWYLSVNCFSCYVVLIFLKNLKQNLRFSSKEGTENSIKIES